MNSTKLIITLTIFAILNNGSLADSPSRTCDSVFILTSPRNQCYAVQTIQSVRYEPINQQETSIIYDVRFQVFDNKSGKLRWEAKRNFGEKSDVYLADDGEHVIVIPSRFWSYGWGVMHGAPEIPPSPDAWAELKALPVIQFYKRDKLIKKYSLADLEFSVTNLSVSVSHVYFLESYRPFDQVDCLDIRAVDRVFMNPSFRENTMTVIPVDKRTRWFNFTTGELIKTETDAERTDRLQEFDVFREKMGEAHKKMDDPFALGNESKTNAIEPGKTLQPTNAPYSHPAQTRSEKR